MWGKVCVLAALIVLPVAAQAAGQRETRGDAGDRGSQEEVLLGCTVQSDHSLSGCKVLNSVSDAAGKEAVSRTNGRMLTERGSPGDHVQVTYIYRGQD